MTCNPNEHKWSMYQGFTDSFEHCASCGMKKKDYRPETSFPSINHIKDALSRVSSQLPQPVQYPNGGGGGAGGGLQSLPVPSFSPAQSVPRASVHDRLVDFLKEEAMIYGNFLYCLAISSNLWGQLQAEIGAIVKHGDVLNFYGPFNSVAVKESTTLRDDRVYFSTPQQIDNYKTI